MAARQSSPVVRFVATLFTSLVAPTLVAVITTTIREAPKADAMPTVCAYRGTPTVAPAPVPTVTLLPPQPVAPSPAPARGPFVWRPVKGSNESAAVRRNLASGD